MGGRDLCTLSAQGSADSFEYPPSRRTQSAHRTRPDSPALPHRRQARRGRDGCRLEGRRPEARPRSRPEDPPRRVRPGREPAGAVPARGPPAGLAQPFRRRGRLQRGVPRHPGDQPALHRHGVRARPEPRRAPGRRPAGGSGRPRAGDSARRGTPGGARPRRNPPRPEAGERSAHSRGQGKGPRLRVGQARRDHVLRRIRLGLANGHDGGDARRRGARHGGLHEPRADSRQVAGQADRHLVVRLRAV